MSDVFAPFTLPLRREGDASIVDANGRTVLVVDPERDIDDDRPVEAIADHVFAALSPEAPAREGGEHQTVGPIDYDKLRSIIHSATNAVLPFANAPMKTPFSTQERAGMQVEIADLIVADLEKAGGKTPALTPRHEAPADPCGSHKAEGFSIDPCCPHCEAPAEGAGELDEDGDIPWPDTALSNALHKHFSELHGLTNEDASEEVHGVLDVIKSLRARSSAPEAREDYSSLIAARCVALPGKLIDCPVCLAVDNERDRQAAPSADKLRVALEEIAEIGTMHHNAHDEFDRGAKAARLEAREIALAALKAEGAK